MPTQCSPDTLLFAPVEGRSAIASFTGGAITSDAGALLLGVTDRAIGLVERFAACFQDARDPDLIEHELPTLIGQRVFGIALGYEDLVDHDQLRHDPVLAVLGGKLTARRADCAPLAGKSTLNRLEHAPSGEPSRYHRIGHDGAAIERLFVDLFLDAHGRAPKQIILDLDATDDPIHGHQSLPPRRRGRAGFSTATMTAIATCRSTSSAAATCSPPSCAAPTLTQAPGLKRRSPALFARSGHGGLGFVSCCGPTPGSPARR